MGLSKAVVKNRVLILMIALILLVPAVFGMLGTRINYDMLDYLPSDMDTVIGQETLKEDFGKGAFDIYRCKMGRWWCRICRCRRWPS